MTRRGALRRLLPLALVASAAGADPVEDILDRARAECEAAGGSFDASSAVDRIDLDGVAPLDRTIDMADAACAGAPSPWCGSGGCTLHAVVAGRSWSFQAEDWRLIEWDGRPILLIARDGGWCGGAGAQVCYEAVVWNVGEMLTVMPPS